MTSKMKRLEHGIDIRGGLVLSNSEPSAPVPGQVWLDPNATGGSNPAQSGFTLVDRDSARRVSGNISLNSGTWTNIDTGLDLVLSAAAGDFVEYGLSMACGSEAPEAYIDAATVVAGSVVSLASGLSEASGSKIGVRAWMLYVSRAHGVGGSVEFPSALGSGDISAGTVTLRLRGKCSPAAAKTIVANSDSPLQVWAKVWRAVS